MNFKTTAVVSMTTLGLIACGGGGGTATDMAPDVTPTVTTPIVTTPTVTATVQLVAPVDGKVQWNQSTATQVTLKDSAGKLVNNPSCTSGDTIALTVSADCKSITGNRLGSYAVTVSGGGMSQNVMVKVIPQRVVMATNQVSPSSGGANLVVTPQGKLLAWGQNSSGILGQGKTYAALPYQALPVAVKDTTGAGDLQGIVAASAGAGVSLALNEDGEVFVWGTGQPLAFSSQDGSGLLVKVRNAANTGSLNHIVAVSAGDGNVMALADDGTVYTWGYYIGQGAVNSAVYPVQVKAGDGVNTLSDIVGISAGSDYSVALNRDGKVFAWGFNSSGRAGAPATTQTVGLPNAIKLASDGTDLSGIVSISAGYNFTLALAASGKVYAWGDNSSGQMGQGVQYGDYVQAVAVKDVTGSADLNNIASVSAGGNHGLAVDNSGKVFSWGYSQNGQLGDGPNHPLVNQSTLPGAVVSEAGTGQLSGMIGVATGYAHSMALAPDGTILIWGTGFYANLGQGDAASFPASYVPLTLKNESGSGALSLGPLTVTRDTYRRYR